MSLPHTAYSTSIPSESCVHDIHHPSDQTSNFSSSCSAHASSSACLDPHGVISGLSMDNSARYTFGFIANYSSGFIADSSSGFIANSSSGFIADSSSGFIADSSTGSTTNF
ncbi:hypothetical protein K439DRAFT_1610909 [Ramaria rubella]|nr:hypothetical protein K439DRAFT_1610909 [Ramaria rubella]